MTPADLVYVTDDKPGITRHKSGRGWRYVAPDGTTIARGPERQRLEALAVPPAYLDVWYCPLSNGHLQATGRDARRRKQYRYHPDWSAHRAETKFEGLQAFGHALPRLRRRLRRDLDTGVGAREFALAAAVSLIDESALRVGSPEYTRENGSYGALTLRGRHMTLEGSSIDLAYRAKGGKRVRKQITSKRLARILGRINDLPGAEIFTWTDEEGTAHILNSSALNTYISDASGMDQVTAKTFRTWTGTLAAFEVAEKGNARIKDICEAAASVLNNTPTIARNSYIHPKVIAQAREEPLVIEGIEKAYLRVAEGRLLAFLEQ